ncbi:hypothetical protein [Metamycoplasma hyosynoviae]|uniref:Lipoprotein-associated type-17 domain-containing protein n=1 Tax=Metamycoplasma hyosynoviae TaxID=29559 RepID=A0A9Q9BW55_9BACT|nr:hypothetical protein [Metamycoplasma hyosynoviae]MDC8921327.1 hypothetical protein [Metamycoplasma hyosynoviae]MDD1358932.1 hypothetical protein [Metamycoplasma hyosynoviae]MDD1361644.1 hypothetical protein [Metamycoplasma hyosynoviae]MDD7895748.1 hypothetical protein [Metamycoplasma hyosynoviae]UTO25850.1 hypothetical protein NMG93_03190 [Metamycoplasma hyosynoviae]
MIDDPSKYEIVEKSWSVTKSVLKNLEVYFQLKNKDTKLISSKRKVEIKGFKQSEASTLEEKALQEALNAITLSYEDGPEVLKKIDVGDLDIAKVKLKGKKEGFDYRPKFKNETPNKQNYNEGFRTVVITVKKGSKSLSKEINLECFKSDYDVIIKQRELVKTIDLNQTSETKSTVESLFQGGNNEIDIFYDFDQKTYFDKKYTESNRKPILDMSKVSWAFGTIFGNGKLIKLGENKYKAKVTLAKSWKVSGKWNYIYDTKFIETNELSFQIIDQTAIDKLAEDNKDKFDYPDKTTIVVEQAAQDKIILPNVKLQNIPVKFNITSLQKDSEHQN